jgi:sugar phosphate isomerase/epimerase
MDGGEGRGMATMKVGIDSYSFHRYFGEVYPGLQEDPGRRWDMATDFVDYAVAQGVDEVALETLFFPALDEGYCRDLKARLDEAGLPRIAGWGHPDGLHGGRDEQALADLKRHIPVAASLGASIMRIVVSSMLYVNDPKEPQIRGSIRMLKEAVEVARNNGVTLALENHIDFTSQELLQIVEGVDSEYLKVNFDTGNALRLFEDPVAAAQRLAPYTVATHTKDIAVHGKGGTPMERFTWWPSCPVGSGLVDVPALAAVLDRAGFRGSLAVELDLLAPPWAAQHEEDLVAESLTYLRSVIAATARA